MLRPALGAVFLLFLPSVLRAFPGVPGEYPRGLDFDVEGAQLPLVERLVVFRGSARAPVPEVPLIRKQDQVAVDPSPDKTAILVRYDNGVSTRTVRLPLAVLEARLENALAMKAHRAKDFEGAARGFTKALAEDPGFDLAAINLACAHAMAGKRAAAVDALRPLLKRAALLVYHRALTDPELASVAEAPEIRALKAARSGTARWDPSKRRLVGGVVAYSPAYRAVAALRQTTLFSEDDAVKDRTLSRLVILSADSGKTLLDWDLAGARAELVDRLLADLGFDAPEQEAKDAPRVENTTQTAPIAFTRLGAELALINDGTRGVRAVLKRGAARIAESDEVVDPLVDVGPQNLESAVYAPSAGVVVFFYGWFSGEGAGDWMIKAPGLLRVPPRLP
jgi:hypothetical protein